LIKNNQTITNTDIKADKLLLINEQGKSVGVVSYDQAMLLASEKQMDVVLVNANINPPIAKIIDFKKELYRQEKSRRKQRAKSKIGELKELSLSYNIDKHDFETKAKRAKEFFADGNKVRVTIQLRGRQMLFQNKARQIIEDFCKSINGTFEQATKREGYRFSATMKLKK